MHYISLVKLVVPSEPPAWEHKGRQQRVSAPVKEVCGGWGGGGTPGKKLLHPENFRPETYNSQQGPPFTGCRQPRVYENKLPIDLSNLVQGCTERGKGSDVIREAARPKKCILPAARQSGFPIYMCPNFYLPTFLCCCFGKRNLNS